MFRAVRSIWSNLVGLLVEDGKLALGAIGALAVTWLAAGTLGDAAGWFLLVVVLALVTANVLSVGVRLRECPFTPERVLAALRAKKNEAKKIDLTEGVDPTAPQRLREHGGSLWFKGKGPMRHPEDPARREVPAAGGDD